MSERIYYVHRSANSVLGKIVRPVTKEETVQKKSLFGKIRYEKVTHTENKEATIPLLMYAEDGKYHEFFTGTEVKCSYGPYYFFVNDAIPEEERKNKYYDLYLQFQYSTKNTEKLNATQFAALVEEWLPYRDEIEKRIRARIRETGEKFLEDTARQREEQARALTAEQKSEAWLDSMIKKGKF